MGGGLSGKMPLSYVFSLHVIGNEMAGNMLNGMLDFCLNNS